MIKNSINIIEPGFWGTSPNPGLIYSKYFFKNLPV